MKPVFPSARSVFIQALVASLLVPPLLAQGRLEKQLSNLQIEIRHSSPPPTSQVEVRADQRVCGKRRASMEIGTDAQGNLKNVVVWLESPSLAKKRSVSPKEPAILRIQDCRFNPRILIVAPHQEVQVWNDDPILYNLRTLSRINPAFYRAFPPNLEVQRLEFSKPEIIPLRCDIHPWMRNFVVVANHDYYAVSDSHGVAEIKNLSTGNYRLHLWHEVLGSRRVESPISVQTKTKTIRINWEKL